MNWLVSLREWVSNNSSAILSTLIGSGLTALIAFLYGKTKSAINSRKRWLKKIYPKANIFNERQAIVLPSAVHTKKQLSPSLIGVRPQPLLTFQDSEGFAFLYGLLNQLSIATQICFLDTSDREQNIFCIGGPFVNSASKRAFDLVPDKVQFERNTNNVGLRDRISGTLHSYMDGVKDYGVILKRRNPANIEKSYTVFAGIGDAGTAGAAYYFTTRLKDISKKFANKDFLIIVKVNVPHSARSAELLDEYGID